jgi:hypothetical protein
MKKLFSLIPFRSSDLPCSVGIAGTVSRMGGSFTVCYTLTDPHRTVPVPSLSDRPERKDKLWEDICFELFLAPVGVDAYHEFNLAPSGDWNVYAFESYRRGMQKEKSFGSLPFFCEKGPSKFFLRIDLDASPLIRAAGLADIGIAAVLKDRRGRVSFWALAHPHDRPDFHRREGFLITL